MMYCTVGSARISSLSHSEPLSQIHATLFFMLCFSPNYSLTDAECSIK